MNTYIAIAVLVFVAFLVVAVLKKKGSGSKVPEVWPFYAKKLLTQPEQVLFHRLVTSLPDCVVLAQVQLSRLLGVAKGANFGEWNNKINRMSLDFVVCRADFSVIAAIELDDKTHEAADRVQADEKKNQALSSAGVPLIRWNVRSMPDEAQIREALKIGSTI